ncbi:hypothetical protein ACGFNV_13735 [Streptomyces sp. NPDC048751]|uniref:hypothetical protein n=1 Tax=Streptomyces sp. NPDC048751 TaxID=3365591 RepID=UPI0037235CD3
MILRWVVFALFTVTVSGLAWGVSGMVENGGCPDGRNRCAGSPEVVKYFVAVMVGAFGMVPGFVAVVRTLDWRPLLGLPTGAVIGTGITLWRGQTLGFWIVVVALLVGTSALTFGLRATLASFPPAEGAPGSR